MKKIALGLLLLMAGCCGGESGESRPRLGMHIDSVMKLPGWQFTEDDVAYRRNWSRYSAFRSQMTRTDYLWLTFENDTLVNIQQRRTM